MFWKWKLHWQVFLGMALGALIAIVSPTAAGSVTIFGTIFMRLLRMVIVPLIFTSIVSGVVGIGEPKTLGRLGAKTLGYYFLSSILAILMGLTVANVLQPGRGQDVIAGQEIRPDDLAQPGGPGDVLLRMIPENPVAAAADGDILGLIFFALAFGLAVTFLPTEPRTALSSLIQYAFEAMMKLTSAVVRLAPLGVLGLIAGAVTQMGVGVFQRVGPYMLMIALGLILHFVVTLPALYWLFTRRNPWPHYRAMIAPMQLAFSTSSSSATLPVTMETVEEKAGISNRVSSFVLPLGSTVNMDGTALYECAGVLFIAQSLGVDLTLGQQGMLVLTAFLASVGAAGVPSAGLVMIFIVLEAVNLSNEAAFALVGLMLAVDRPLDMFRTVVNITSDTIGAAIIAHSEGEELTYER